MERVNSKRLTSNNSEEYDRIETTERIIKNNVTAQNLADASSYSKNLFLFIFYF